MEETPVTLVSIAQGSAVELFDRALEQILENIGDVNTDPEAVREITMKFRFRPNRERNVIPVGITTVTKLAGINPASTFVYTGRRGGKYIAVESNPEQLSILTEPTPIRAVPAPIKE